MVGWLSNGNLIREAICLGRFVVYHQRSEKLDKNFLFSLIERLSCILPYCNVRATMLEDFVYKVADIMSEECQIEQFPLSVMYNQEQEKEVGYLGLFLTERKGFDRQKMEKIKKQSGARMVVVFVQSGVMSDVDWLEMVVPPNLGRIFDFV